MAKVIWTIEALEDVASIRAYITQFDPSAAYRVAQRLLDAGDRLSEFPERGSPADGAVRKLSLVWPYVLRYEVMGGQVNILGIRHGARDQD